MKKIFFLLFCITLIVGSCKKESPVAQSDNWDSYYGYTPDRFPIETNEGYGYIDNTGSTKINPNPQLIYAAGFSYGKAWVINSDTLIGYIDESGNWAINPNPNYNFCGNFSKEGFAPVQNYYTGLWGYINISGTIQYCSYDTVYDFHNGLAL